METPLVSIACITYNHEKYVRDTLEGLLMQKTNFPYEIVIHDDASTDDTANIIREYENKYPNLINPIYQNENQYKSTKRILINFVFPKCRGKYIALCEGDDYWTDPLKLQKQVDFLERNPSYGLIHTNLSIINESTSNVIQAYRGSVVEGNIFSQLMKGNFISTVTVCFRAKFLSGYLALLRNEIYNWSVGDYPMWLYIAYYSNIGYLNEVTAMYRVHEGSVTDFNNKKDAVKHIIENIKIVNCILNRLNVDQQIKKQTIKYNSKKLLLLGIETDDFSLISEYLGFNSVLHNTIIFFLKIKLIRSIILQTASLKNVIRRNNIKFR